MMIGHEWAGKIKNLKSLFEFRVLLRKKVAEYKKIIGKDPSHDLLKNILYSCMDLESKQHIVDRGLDVIPRNHDGSVKTNSDGSEVSLYKVFCDDIDRRYKLQFGTLEIRHKKDSDDPMGLHTVGDGQQEADRHSPVAATGGDASLDAFAKGKGKGDGRCRVCNGEGHFARDCPSVEPVSPQAVECNGCHGKGHLNAQCPTVNPELKVYRQQKGWESNWGGGKKGTGKGNWSGSGNWGGKGYGGKGKGQKGKGKGKGKGGFLPELDVMSGYYGGAYYGDSYDQGHYDQNTSYLKSLSTVTPAKNFESENRYAPIAETQDLASYEVDISELIIPNRAPGKARRLEAHKVSKTKFGPSHECDDVSCGCCPNSDHFEVRPELTSALVPN